DEPQHRQGGDALAAAAFADHPEGLAGADRVGDAVARAHHPGRREEMRAEIVDFENVRAGRRARYFRGISGCCSLTQTVTPPFLLCNVTRCSCGRGRLEHPWPIRKRAKAGRST